MAEGTPVTRLLLIRHGRTDPGFRLCGSLDIPLSADGLAQLAALVARRPAAAAPDALYTSTLARARQVARALAEPWGLQPLATDSLREIHCGRLEGVRLEEIQASLPSVWARHEAQRDEDLGWPGGESYREFRARVLHGLAEIAARHAGSRVAVVTHAGVISQVLGVIRGRAACVWDADRPDPLTATEVTWGRDGPLAVLSFNSRNWF